MAFKVFPSVNSVGGSSQKYITERTMSGWAHAMAAGNCVLEGYDLSSAGLAISISPGAGAIRGYRVEMDAAYTADLASGWYSIYLQLERDGAGNIASVAAACEQSDDPMPQGPDILPLWRLYAAGGVVAQAYDWRAHSPWPVDLAQHYSRDTVYETFFDSLDGFALSLGASGGAITLGGGYVELATGAQPSDTCMRKYIYSQHGLCNASRCDYAVGRFSVCLPAPDAKTQAYIHVASYLEAPSYAAIYLGASGWYLRVKDADTGIVHTSTKYVPAPAGAWLDLAIALYPREPRAELWYDRWLVDSLPGCPSGRVTACECYIRSNATGVRKMQIGSYRYYERLADV